jgi:hypothetical protein
MQLTSAGANTLQKLDATKLFCWAETSFKVRGPLLECRVRTGVKGGPYLSSCQQPFHTIGISSLDGYHSLVAYGLWVKAHNNVAY